MIKIIDATLTMLDGYSITKEQALKFISLLKEVSIREIVISPGIYELIKDDLPEEMVYDMELSYGAENKKYPGISFFITNYCDGTDGYIKNIQMNELTEIKEIEKVSEDTRIRITGLDDMLLYENSKIYKKCIEQINQRNVILYPENSYYCASAIGVNYLMENNSGIVMSTFHGIGNKAETEQLILAMHICKRYKINMSFAGFRELRILFEEITGCKIDKHAAVIGEEIFFVESGIHVDGILKKASNYELYPSELVGAKRKIVLGKHSGIASIKYKLERMGIQRGFNTEHILQRVKRLSIKKGGSVTDDEFKKIIAGCEINEEMDKNC